MTPRFHCPLPLAEGAEIALPDAAAHHAARVLRLAAGDAITLFGGDDGEFAARILRIEPRGVHVRIGSAHAADRESPLTLTLVQGLAAADRMDYAIQKAVELGVHSPPQLHTREWHVKCARWRPTKSASPIAAAGL